MVKGRHVGLKIDDDFTVKLLRLTYGRGPERNVSLTLEKGFVAVSCKVWGVDDYGLMAEYNASVPDAGRISHAWRWLSGIYKVMEERYEDDPARFMSCLIDRAKG